jgi:hypothetical protein
MKVDKFQLSEGFENLLDVAFREVEVERTNIKSGEIIIGLMCNLS